MSSECLRQKRAAIWWHMEAELMNISELLQHDPVTALPVQI